MNNRTRNSECARGKLAGAIDKHTTHTVSDAHGEAAGLLRRLLRAVAAHRTARNETTTYAVTKATTLLAAGDLRGSLSMLEYAQRGAPSDGAISLAIGLARLELGDPLAASPLEKLARRSEWRDLWMALILTRLRASDAERSAADLQEMLSRIAAPRGEFDIALATRVSNSVDAAGWCGLCNAGQLIVSVGQTSLKHLTVLLDGREIQRVQPRLPNGHRDLLLPKKWQSAARIDVLLHGRPLIGSPLDITRIARVEGFVESDDSLPGIRGWCRYPADRERVPAITITAIANKRQRLSVYPGSTESRSTDGDEFALRYNFAVDADRMDCLGDAIRICGPNGHVLYGGPIRTRASRESASSHGIGRATFPATRREPSVICVLSPV